MSSEKVDIATKIKFADVCRMLEKIKNANGARQKETVLQKYLESFNEFSRKFKETHGARNCESNFYPVLRCMLPRIDKTYGIKITTMGKLYIKVLNLAPDGVDAKKLNQTEIIQGTSDYADVVFSVMRSRSGQINSTLSMADIHQLLDRIAENDRRKTERELIKFIEVASPLEQKWLIRMILKKLHLGLGEQKIFSLYHPQAQDLYNRTTDLKRVCECVESGEPIEITDSIQPHQYVRPMLCEQLDLTRVKAMLTENVYYLETKMDGERFQIHLDDEKYKYISRNGKDFTTNFGATAFEGQLTPFLVKLFTINVSNIILDGEMMVWDREMNGFRVKGENFDVKSLHRGANLRPCFVAYDVLYLNGVSHVDKPYAERVALLEKIIKEEPGIVMLCKRDKVKSVEHLIEKINEALDAHEEGVVIKTQNGIYKPGVRNGGWYKIKPDYINGIVQEFDLLIIGGYYNRRRTYIDSYLLGVYKMTNDSHDNPIFYSVAKVALGLSLPQRIKLNETLKPNWMNINARNSSCPVEWGPAIPDVWIDPTKSIVLQIKATELAETKSFRTTHSLRFPRIDAIRDDKSWSDCMTLDEFESYSKNHSGVAKIHKRNLTADDLQVSKKMKLSPKKKGAMVNNPYASMFNANEIKKINDICDGLQFCILSTCTGKPSVDQLKAMACRYGGKIVENPSLDTKKCICIAGDLTNRVRRLMSTERYNIVCVDWMIRSFGNDDFIGQMAQPKPRDMISMTADMAEEFKTYFDEFGDSYTDEVDNEELQAIMKEMNVQCVPAILDGELRALEESVLDSQTCGNMFHRTNCYFYSPTSQLSNILLIAKLIFEAKSGSCVSEETLTSNKERIHIIVDRANIDGEMFNQWMHQAFVKHKSRVKVLSYNWILDCDKENQIVDQTDYLLYEEYCT